MFKAQWAQFGDHEEMGLQNMMTCWNENQKSQIVRKRLEKILWFFPNFRLCSHCARIPKCMSKVYWLLLMTRGWSYPKLGTGTWVGDLDKSTQYRGWKLKTPPKTGVTFLMTYPKLGNSHSPTATKIFQTQNNLSSKFKLCRSSASVFCTKSNI